MSDLLEEQIENEERTVEEENAVESEKPLHTLKVNSLYKMFGKKKVVQGVDFKMNTGEVLGL